MTHNPNPNQPNDANKPGNSPADADKLMMTVEALVGICHDRDMTMADLQRMLACNVILTLAMGSEVKSVLEALAIMVKRQVDRADAELAANRDPEAAAQMVFQAIRARDPKNPDLEVFVVTNHRTNEEGIATLLAAASAAGHSK